MDSRIRCSTVPSAEGGYSRREFIFMTLQMLVWAGLTGCSSSCPVLGSSPISQPLIVEDHSQLLAKWAEQGIRDAVLINIDAHDDIRWIPDNKVNALKDIYSRRDWKKFSESNTKADVGLYNIGNWIYAGARLGMFREVCWVIPGNLFSQSNPLELLRNYLAYYRFNEDDIRSFTVVDNRFHGSFHGIPLTICSIESLPVVQQPLLLSIDTDFFSILKNNYGAKYLTALQATFTALYKMNYKIDKVGVCYSVNGDFMLPVHRWVGDAVISILRKPEIVNAVPAEELLLLQKCDKAYGSGNAAEILRLVEGSLQKERIPSLLVYQAYAYLLQDQPKKAFEAAMNCWKTDKLYRTCLPYFGTLYLENGNYLAAEKFFRAGFAADPAMENGVFRFAQRLKKNNKLSEAISWYERAETSGGSFPSRLLIAEIHSMLGESQLAITDIKVVVDNLKQDIYSEVDNREIADSVYAVIDFCEKNGSGELAGSLTSTPAIKKMLRVYPRS